VVRLTVHKSFVPRTDTSIRKPRKVIQNRPFLCFYVSMCKVSAFALQFTVYIVFIAWFMQLTGLTKDSLHMAYSINCPPMRMANAFSNFDLGKI